MNTVNEINEKLIIALEGKIEALESIIKTKEKINKMQVYEAVMSAFTSGQKYQKDVDNGMSGQYSEFYAPYLDNLINEAIK
ncbi:MAG: hypothetical protein HRT87_07475 [Legionellales bacterium]|nr:hypothetical protein [Legionellales bacterium]